MKDVKIILTRDEWNWVTCWVEGLKICDREGISIIERFSHERLEKARNWVRWEISFKYLFDIETPYDALIPVEIPREYLRVVVFPTGKIAYDFDVKTPTACVALEIIQKIEEQLKDDEEWKRSRW